MSKKLINLSNLQKFLLKLNERFALKKAMKGISEDSEGNIIIGEEGLVPTPDENSKGKFLRSDGTWSIPGDSPLYEPMTQEEGIEGVSEVNKVLSAKTLKAVVEDEISTNENVVHKSGDETIDGTKTFTSIPYVANNQTTMGYLINNIAIARNDVPSEYYHHTFRACDKNNNILGEYCIEKNTYGEAVLNMGVRSEDASGTQISYGMQFRMTNDGSLVRFFPSANNKVHLGDAGAKWASVYSTNNITNKVITYSVTNHNNTSSMTVSGGSSWDTGSTLFLYGNSHSNYPGAFNLTAKNTTNESKLIGFPNGTLTWNGKNVAIDENLVHTSGDETIGGNKTFSNRISFPSGYFISTDPNDNSLRISRSGSDHGNNYKIIIQGNNGKIFAPNGFQGNLQGNADTATSANSATYATTQATTDNSTKIATTAWVRSYVDSVAGNNTVGSSVSAYWSNSSLVTATGQSSSGGNYPECYSEYVSKTPVVGTIYSGAQLYTVLNTYASATGSLNNNSIYVTSNKAQATLSNPLSATAKYLCTTANTFSFRAYTARGNTSSVGTSSVVNATLTKSIFIRVQ